MTTAEPRWNAPIFIVGSPRSGTTLLRNLLNRHPAIAVCRETDYYHYVYRRRRAFGDLGNLKNRQRLVKEYLSTQRIRRMKIDLQALENVLMDEASSYPALFASLLRFYAKAHGKSRCGEKTPLHAYFTETLCEWYPGGRIIHLLRDPRDVVVSLGQLPSAPNSLIGRAKLWLRRNLAALRSQHRPQYLQVRYEELVTDPEKCLGGICRFLEEEYSPIMLVPDWDPTADRPWYRRAEESVTTQRIGVWRKELTEEQIALIEWLIGPHMKTFGYEAVGRKPSSGAIARAFALGAFDTVRRKVGEFPGVWYSLTCSRELVKEESARERYRTRNLTRSVPQ